MEKVFDNPSKLEALVKQRYGIPDFMMMENAALALKQLIEKLASPASRILILCGKGNNGGDGYALARLLQNNYDVFLYKLAEPTAAEAKTQYQTCTKLKLNFISEKKALELLKTPDSPAPAPLVVVDCLFGTGFRGELPAAVQKLIDTANSCDAIRIACDISSGLAFDAHYTVTMGEHKLALCSDRAKQVSGQIIVADLGVDNKAFQAAMPPAAFLITDKDLKLPFRTNKAAHKGTYGHTAVFAGEKSGAAIICATAAMNFGSGLTSLVQTPDSNLKQFKISPELMISKSLPAKTTCAVFGPGIKEGTLPPQTISKVPALVFDAGVFGNPDFPALLKELDSRPGSRIVLTPHLLELVRLCKSLKINPAPTVEALANDPALKIKIGCKFNKLFPNTTVVIKSANTFIASGGQTYIVTDGCPSLAKGGSGDVLAGMLAALLAQGYSAKDAAITACEAHALGAKKTGASTYALTPAKLIKAVSSLV
ncbi:MAG: NAD(P)H-hydrate dehydratase [Treponema sp.]|nr:NAD(P)H-hydrate dehydratase [Treponema sp.]